MHALPRSGKALDDREVGVHVVRPVDRSAVGVPELSNRSTGEAADIEPLPDILVNATIRVTDLIWPVERVAVAVEVHAGRIRAVEDEHGEARGDFFNHVNAVSEQGVGGVIPTAAVLLPLPNGRS
jgi:hypothetical protein